MIKSPPFGKWSIKLVMELRRRSKERKQLVSQKREFFNENYFNTRQYIEPYCQPQNPIDDNPSAARESAFSAIDRFFAATSSESGDRKYLFVFSDAGMGKTALLVQLWLRHLKSFLPTETRCELLKLGDSTAADIQKISDKNNTILLLDALDEDNNARSPKGNVETRILELFQLTESFKKVVISCRTQFFPKAGLQIALVK